LRKEQNKELSKELSKVLKYKIISAYFTVWEKDRALKDNNLIKCQYC
jgi:hypothetical protein